MKDSAQKANDESEVEVIPSDEEEITDTPTGKLTRGKPAPSYTTPQPISEDESGNHIVNSIEYKLNSLI